MAKLKLVLVSLLFILVLFPPFLTSAETNTALITQLKAQVAKLQAILLTLIQNQQITAPIISTPSTSHTQTQTVVSTAFQLTDNVANQYIVELSDPSLADKKVDLENKIKNGQRIDPGSELLVYRSLLDLRRAQFELSLPKLILDRNNKPREFSRVFNGLTLNLQPNEVELVKRIPGVKKVFQNRIVRPALDFSVPLVHANTIWPLNANLSPCTSAPSTCLTGRGMEVAIIDTGVDYNHPDLTGRFIGGYDFGNNDDDPIDEIGHGTHVASTAVGGGSFYRGVAPDANFYAYKISYDSTGRATVDNIIAALERAVDPNSDFNFNDRADVINISFSLGGTPDNEPSSAIDRASNIGSVVVVAAGNDGPSPSSITGPARQAITVGAVGYAPAGGATVADFSSRGPVTWTDWLGRQQTINKPDVVAPGTWICAASLTRPSSGGCSDFDFQPGSGLNYVPLSGTSMATPHVSGLATLVRQWRPNLTPLEVKNLIMTSATNLGLDQTIEGRGLINATNLFEVPTFTITATSFGQGAVTPSGVATINQGTNQTYTIAPATGYYINQVYVDSLLVGNPATYTFSNIQSNHTIYALFSPINQTGHTIESLPTANGVISPIGRVTVPTGGSQTFTITPNSGYQISDVYVNGSSVGVRTSYTFSNAQATYQTITATFVSTAPSPVYFVEVYTVTNGAISPSGVVTINVGATQTFSITPNAGYQIYNVYVNNSPVGPVSSYTFSNNLQLNHQTIQATFSPASLPPPTIISSYPPTGAIDARGTGAGEFKVVNLIFSQPLGVDWASLSNYVISSTNASSPSVANISTNQPAGFQTQIYLDLSRPLIAGERIRITHKPSNTGVCLGFLPGDVNGDGTTAPADQLDLIDALNGVKKLPIYSTDIDRSGVAAPADILALTDLLNGVGVGAGGTVWNGKKLPACPSGGTGAVSTQTQFANSLSALSTVLRNLQSLLQLQ